MATTLDNLKDAFAGESQAHQKYRAFAKMADKEGFVAVAKLFRLTAEAERIHAEGHLKALDGVGTTSDNIRQAIAGETYEFSSMYPPMLKQAAAEGHKAKRMFEYAVAAEEVHAKLYQMALETVSQGKDLSAEFYLCPVCGYIEMGKPDTPCPVCGAKPEKFVLAD